MKTEGLFRREALEAKRGNWLGTISLAQPLSSWVLTAFAVAAATAIVLFLFLASYTRRTQVTGQLVPNRGLATVVAPVAGVVSAVNVIEGEAVKAGEPLATVTIPSATAATANTADALAEGVTHKQHGLEATRAAQQQLLVAQSQGLTKQLQAARESLSQLQQEISTQRQQTALASDALGRFRKVEAQQFVSTIQLKQQEGNLLAQRSQLQALERQATEARRGIAQLEQELAAIPGQRLNAEADYQRNQAALEQERVEAATRGAQRINAPVTGLVATALAKPGQAVQAGQAMMSLLPKDSALEAELLVPSQSIGFINPGDTVLLRYRAYPYQKFGHYHGRVFAISRSALGPSELASIGVRTDAGSFYRVTVALDKQSILAYGKEEPLRPGMLVDADVLGEHRRLIQWIFEPLYSLKGRI